MKASECGGSRGQEKKKGTKQKSLKLFQIYTLTLKLKHECIFMKEKCE